MARAPHPRHVSRGREGHFNGCASVASFHLPALPHVSGPAPRLFRDSEPTPASFHPYLPQFIGRQPDLADFNLVWHFVNPSVQPSVNPECRRGSCSYSTNPSPRPSEFIAIAGCRRAYNRPIRFSCFDRPRRLLAPSRFSLSQPSVVGRPRILGALSPRRQNGSRPPQDGDIQRYVQRRTHPRLGRRILPR